MTTLLKNQKKQFRVEYDDRVIIAEVRHDDECGNGHNSFSITAEIYEPNRQPGESTTTNALGKTVWLNRYGCCHDEIARHFPQLAPLIKWHLTSTDGPTHYLANALYWAGHSGWRDGKPNSPPNLENLKSTIVYGALPSDADYPIESVLWKQDQDNNAIADGFWQWLSERLQPLLVAFQKDVQSLGFTY